VDKKSKGLKSLGQDVITGKGSNYDGSPISLPMGVLPPGEHFRSLSQPFHQN